MTIYESLLVFVSEEHTSVMSSFIASVTRTAALEKRKRKEIRTEKSRLDVLKKIKPNFISIFEAFPQNRLPYDFVESDSESAPL